MPSEVGLSDGEPAGCQGYGWARHPNATIWLWTHCNLGKGGSYFLFLSTFAWATLRYLEILDENHMKRLQLLHIQNHESGSLVSHATINYTYLKIVDCCNGVLTSKFSFSKLQLLQLLRNHSSRTRASPAHLIPIDGSWQVCNKNCAAVLGFTIKQVLNYIHRQ